MNSGALRQVAALGAAVALCAALPGCSKNTEEAAPPPRVQDTIPVPQQNSILAVPIDMDADLVRRLVENTVPRTLWTIDQHSGRCVAPQKIKIFGARIKVTPPISCTIVGTVTRGAIRLRGEGQDIVADIPIAASISAGDIGGILKGETATGAAMAHARIRLDLGADWKPRGTVRLTYDWTKAPGIDFLGQRVTFADKADEKLAPVLARLERAIPARLAQVDLRGQVAQAWRAGFTSVELNARNPPVWMRITPRKLSYGGYRLEGQRLRLNLGLEALTETFVGPRPADPAPIPLPALAHAPAAERLRFFLPVIADYAELEPVVLRALTRRAQRPFDLPGVGPTIARFEKIEAYGTTEGRIALGVTLAAKPNGLDVSETKGRIWLVARPVNAPNSAEVRFDHLAVSGKIDRLGGDLLIKLGNSPALSGAIAGSLTQNFTNDLNGLLDKIRHAIEEKREGAFVIRAQIGDVQTGQIEAHGQGLYLPVSVTGRASISYAQGNARRPAKAP